MRDVSLNAAGTAVKTSGDQLTAPWYVEYTTEGKNLIVWAGMTPSSDDLTQMRQAVEYVDSSGFSGILSSADSTKALCFATLDGAAPSASPTFTGVPAAPTAAAGTNTTQIATCTFIQDAFLDASGFAGILSATEDTIQEAFDVLDSDAAPIASPTFTGTPAAPTAAAGNSTTQLATTAFVQSAKGTGSYLPAGSMGAGALATSIITDNHLGVWTIADGADVTAAGTLGPFTAGGTITGCKIHYYGDAVGTATADFVYYVGAYATGDDATFPNENSATWSQAMPAAANEYTVTEQLFDSGTLTVAAGDIVSIVFQRTGSGDTYASSVHLVGIELVWS